MITSKQRSKLRALAHHIKPSVFIGKSGLTDGAYSSINESLESRELIKVKFNESKKSKNDLKENASDKLSAHVVGSIGSTLIMYRAHEDKEKRKYKI
tara:strand:- start:753 stop:1043 length:291 start_codon:yes stop_codon:yes gene_type:complete